MGLTSVLNTSLTGLSANQAMLDVVGNNISNVNTVGYKASNLNFQTAFNQTFTYGTPPNGDLGGTNPLQVGMGTQQSSLTTDYSNGSLQTTGVNSDLAVQGNGFFILQDSKQQFTRNGSFQLNSQDKLVNGQGLRVQGYAVDSNFNVVPGVLSDLTIPIGSLSVAQATSNASMTGNLNAGGVVASTPGQLVFNQPMYSGGAAISNPATTTLTSVTNAPGGTSYFQVGDVVTAQGEKGTRTVAPQTFTVGAASTLQDYMNFLQGTMGINTTSGVNGTGAAPGVSLIAGTGGGSQLQITSNLGTNNAVAIKSSDITVNRGGTILNPFTTTSTATANGESVTTSLTAYDSLGTAVPVYVTATLTNANTAGTTWQYVADSPGGTGAGAATNTAVGEGTLQFNNFGQLISTATPTVTINRSGTGASPTLSFNLNFSGVTALSGSSSQLASTSQDGSPPGTLTNYSIGSDGIISGTFSNGLTRTLGQVALATFSNNQGLVSVGNSNFIPGPDSGTAVIAAPGQFSSGTLTAGALEMSNVDLSAEFVNLISASTGFTAASKVITTSNQLLQSLLSSIP